MTVSQTQILIRNDRVETIRNQVIRLLNRIHDRMDFNRAELLLAFNEVTLSQWKIEEYLSTKR